MRSAQRRMQPIITDVAWSVLVTTASPEKRLNRDGDVVWRVVDAQGPRKHVYTQGEMTSQNRWSRYDCHFVRITWHNVWS